MKKISCRFLQRAIYYAPDELRHCCQRYYVKGKLMGDVKVLSAKNNSDVSLENIIKAKNELIEKINKGEKTDCYGCPLLEKAEWKKVEDEKFDHISIEHHAKCNMRCRYCSDTYYGGKLAKYDIQKSLNELITNNKIRDDVQVAWGGGEPTIVKDFNKIIELVNKKIKPKSQRFFSNAINYSEIIAELMKKNEATLTTSVDAGSIETFKLVRKVNQYEKVLKNLKKYYEKSPNNLIIKYILTEDNSSISEIESFVKDMKKYGLSKANFLISSNYYDEKLTLDQGITIIYFHHLLIKNSAKTCALDEHVRPRINKIASTLLNNNKLLEKYPDVIKKIIQDLKEKKKTVKNIIVWGVGPYANLLLNNSVTFSDSNVEFFVDSNPHKQGKKFRNSTVLKPDQILKSNLPILIAASFWYHDIVKQIKLEYKVDTSRILSSSII